VYLALRRVEHGEQQKEDKNITINFNEDPADEGTLFSLSELHSFRNILSNSKPSQMSQHDVFSGVI